MMQITGSYYNYQNITNLLAPLGVKGSGNLVMDVFSASVGNLQQKINDQIFSEESSAALTQLYDKVSDLSEKAKKLTLTDMESVFNDRTAQSSNADVLTATAFDAFSQESGATEATYAIRVDQLAKVQENVGSELIGSEVSVVNEGTNTFNININGQDNEISIEVLAGDTNEVVLQKIETAINDTEIGVIAQITIDNEAGTEQLTLKGNSTGVDNAFSISDITGNAVSVIGLGTATTEAQDAAYNVDGNDFSSGVNNIYLDGGLVEVALKGEGEATLTVAPDEIEVKDALSAFISEINEFIEFLEQNEDYVKEDVLSSVQSFVADHKNELVTFGISEGDDGRLDIDEVQLSEAVSQNLSEVKETFGGLDGLSVQVNNYATRVTTESPLNYAKEAEQLSPDFTDFIYGSSVNMLTEILQGTLLDDIF
jgi:flagellar hook-associated protein 2